MHLKSLAFALLLAASPAAHAQTAPKAPEVLAREAIEKMIEALEGAIANLPQYAAPEIDADGNITIRRVKPPRSTGKAPSPKDNGLTL